VNPSPAPSLHADLFPELALPYGRYRVRLARSADDVDRALRLRFEVFNRELGEGLAESWRTGRDRDEFDAVCDHLLVEDARSGDLAGTYRMQTAARAAAGRGFYSAREFALEALPGEVRSASVELGRACVASARYDTPMKSVIAMPPRMSRVRPAFFDCGRRNALTPFAIASTPVSADDPEANARSSTKSVTVPTPAGNAFGVTACGQLPVAHLTEPTAIVVRSTPMKA